MAGRVRRASVDGRLFLGGTDGSNPVPSSGESGELQYGAFDPGLPQLWFDRAGDAEGDLILQLENVIERAVKAVGPDVIAGWLRRSIAR